MPVVLTQHSYGKSQVRLTKVTRHADRHDLLELCVAIELQGDFNSSYVSGDNSRIVATDTMKNIVYALAKKQTFGDIESFGQTLADHFLKNYAHVSGVTVSLTEQAWRRVRIDGREHPHAFLGGGNESRTSKVTLTRQGLRIESGLANLYLLKTTNSSFAGFIRDSYTTLPETEDRILATVLSAEWVYRHGQVDWNGCHQNIRQALLEVFAQHKSQSVQQTLHAMGTAALESCPEIEEISLRMPNQHRVLVNLEPFGLENHNEIFVATEEPYGLITGTLRRG